jgi:hypothetical protein
MCQNMAGKYILVSYFQTRKILSEEATIPIAPKWSNITGVIRSYNANIEHPPAGMF